MDHFSSLIETILILVALICSTFWLKKRGAINENSKNLFAKMTTDYALPALIFSSLAITDLKMMQFLPAAILLGSSIVVLFLAYFLGKLLKLNRSQLGVFIVLSGFGSSSSLGYPLIKEMMPTNHAAIGDALVIGEFGASLPFFIIGVAIIMYFGQKKENSRLGFTSAMLPFFKSPIFIALILGIVASFIKIPLNNVVFSFVIKVLQIISGSILVFVAISIGLMLRPVKVRTILPLVSVICLLKLVVEPLLAMSGVSIFNISSIESEVLIIETAMPSGAVACVLADRYGCDGTFASVVVIITYVVALFSLPLMFFLNLL